MDERFDLTAASEQLNRQGYVVLEGALEPALLRQLQVALADLFRAQTVDR